MNIKIRNGIEVRVASVLFSVMLLCSCGQLQSGTAGQQGNGSQHLIRAEAHPPTDSIAILAAFEQQKTNPSFLKELALENDTQFSWNDDMLRIIRGDLNGDGTSDALLCFSIEGRGGGNNADVHYAVFLKTDHQWVYQSQFDANAGSPDLFYGFDTIANGIIRGAILDNNEVLPAIPVTFIFKDKALINTYTALHKMDNEQREFLKIENIITATGKLVPLTATLEAYELILGKGRISTPEERPECGTYFEEGTYSEWYDEHNLLLELADNKQAAWRSVFIRGTDYKVNTDKGTITANTTLEELENIFYNDDSWEIGDGDDGGKIFSIPDGPESDNQLRINFSKDGKLEGVYLFIPC